MDAMQLIARAQAMPKTHRVTTEDLYLLVEGRKYPVRSIKDASEKFCVVRDRMGVGASQMPQVLLVNDHNKTRYYVSYNGRVWAGAPNDWKAGDKPVYDNRHA